MKAFWVLAATGAMLSTGVMAETKQTATQPVTPAPAVTAPTSATASSKDSLRQQMMADIQKAGFSDVRVRPDSFLVQAKDKNGTPITMLIDPNSVTEVVDNNGASGGANAGATGGSFTTVPNGDKLSSKIVGTDVYNNDHHDIGTIKDVAYSGANIKAYIVSVGGFLGMGDHYVAINPSAINVTQDPSAKTWRATMNTTADQLKAAPEFKYPS